MNRFTKGAGLVTKVVLVGSSVALLGASCWQGVGTNTNVGVETNTNAVTTNTLNENINSSAEIDTSDWLTYTNEDYKLSLKYPNYLTLNDYSSYSYFPNDTTQLLRLQLNEESNKAAQEFHFFIFSSSLLDTTEKIKNADQVGSKVLNENYVEVNDKTYYLITMYTSLGSTVDYYLTNSNQSTLAWVISHEEQESLVKGLLQNTSRY